MLFHFRSAKREPEVQQASADFDEAVRQFQESLKKAEAAHGEEVISMFEGLVPTHKRGKE